MLEGIRCRLISCITRHYITDGKIEALYALVRVVSSVGLQGAKWGSIERAIMSIVSRLLPDILTLNVCGGIRR